MQFELIWGWVAGGVGTCWMVGNWWKIPKNGRKMPKIPNFSGPPGRGVLQNRKNGCRNPVQKSAKNAKNQLRGGKLGVGVK